MRHTTNINRGDGSYMDTAAGTSDQTTTTKTTTTATNDAAGTTTGTTRTTTNTGDTLMNTTANAAAELLAEPHNDDTELVARLHRLALVIGTTTAPDTVQAWLDRDTDALDLSTMFHEDAPQPMRLGAIHATYRHTLHWLNELADAANDHLASTFIETLTADTNHPVSATLNVAIEAAGALFTTWQTDSGELFDAELAALTLDEIVLETIAAHHPAFGDVYESLRSLANDDIVTYSAIHARVAGPDSDLYTRLAHTSMLLATTEAIVTAVEQEGLRSVGASLDQWRAELDAAARP